jgi:hypothetical protein
MNWTRGFFRLWLVASLLWVVAVGWLTWPGAAPEQYVRYWYYRVAHSEVVEWQRNAAAADYKARVDAVDNALRGKVQVPTPPPDHTTDFAQLGSPQLQELQEFTSLEALLDEYEIETERWLAYTFGPPVILLIVGASLLWAVRGFAGTPGPR